MIYEHLAAPNTNHGENFNKNKMIFELISLNEKVEMVIATMNMDSMLLSMVQSAGNSQ